MTYEDPDNPPKRCGNCHYRYGVLTLKEFKWASTPFQQAKVIAMKRREDLPPLKVTDTGEIPKGALEKKVEADVIQDLAAFVTAQKAENIMSFFDSAEYMMEHGLLFEDPDLLKYLINKGRRLGTLADVLDHCQREGVRYGKAPTASGGTGERDREDTAGTRGEPAPGHTAERGGGDEFLVRELQGRVGHDRKDMPVRDF